MKGSPNRRIGQFSSPEGNLWFNHSSFLWQWNHSRAEIICRIHNWSWGWHCSDTKEIKTSRSCMWHFWVQTWGSEPTQVLHPFKAVVLQEPHLYSKQLPQKITERLKIDGKTGFKTDMVIRYLLDCLTLLYTTNTTTAISNSATAAPIAIPVSWEGNLGRKKLIIFNFRSCYILFEGLKSTQLSEMSKSQASWQTLNF